MVKDVYAKYKETFCEMRTLIEIGDKLLLMSLTKEEDETLAEKYKNKELQWIRLFIKQKIKSNAERN